MGYVGYLLGLLISFLGFMCGEQEKVMVDVGEYFAGRVSSITY